MALSDANSKSIIIQEMQLQGFLPLNPATGGEAEKYIDALAIAINRILKEDADVIVSGGSSSGTHNIQ